MQRTPLHCSHSHSKRQLYERKQYGCPCWLYEALTFEQLPTMPSKSTLIPLLFSATALAEQWPMTGWQAYRNFDLYKFRPDDITRQFSSYDRTNANDDGFEGTYSCLYNTTSTPSRCVIAEASGPGEISDMWFTYSNDSVVGAGNILIELDGKEVLAGELQSIVNGDMGDPFTWPFVGNTNDTSGGNVIKVPMPYKNTMRVSMSTNPHFYHVVYRSFPGDVEVETFDPKDKAEDVLETVRAFGVRDPKERSKVKLGWHWGWRRWNGRGGWGGWGHGWHGGHEEEMSASGKDMVTVQGSGIIDELEVRVPDIQGAVPVQDDGRAFGKEGSSRFSMAIDRQSTQCRITRRLDQSVEHQNADLWINGRKAGTWADSGATINATWLDQYIDLPPTICRGKAELQVENKFVSSDFDFNEFYYAMHCKTGRDWTLTDLFNVGPANVHDEAAHNYRISGQTWQGWRAYKYEGERAEKSDSSVDLLNDMMLKMEFDGRQTVEVPVGSFFGTALDKNQGRSLLLSVDTFVENGAFRSWFPMPFAHSVKISLVGAGNSDTSISVKWHNDDSLQKDKNSWGYFSTQHRRAETVTGQLWDFLSTTGPGVAYGVTHAIRGSIIPPDNPLGFLEGDFKVWLNRTTPGSFDSATQLGTGTEDFYESGWYFAQTGSGYDTTTVPYAMPLTGLTGVEIQEGRCVGSCLSPMRLFMGDSIAFGEEGISMNIEHGFDDNNVNADYETTAFYYAA